MSVAPISPLVPRQKVPDLSLPLVGGGTWSVATARPERFSLIVVYRGLHCPICSTYLRELDGKVTDFAARGTEVVAISSDDAERAAAAKENWRLSRLPVAYGLGLDAARRWGLYISSGRGPTSARVEEPALFVEPGLFLIRADGTLYFASVQTMPFARPRFADILGALDFVISKDYPARGEVTGLPTAAA